MNGERMNDVSMSPPLTKGRDARDGQCEEKDWVNDFLWFRFLHPAFSLRFYVFGGPRAP